MHESIELHTAWAEARVGYGTLGDQDHSQDEGVPVVVVGGVVQGVGQGRTAGVWRVGFGWQAGQGASPLLTSSRFPAREMGRRLIFVCGGALGASFFVAKGCLFASNPSTKIGEDVFSLWTLALVRSLFGAFWRALSKSARQPLP